MPPIMKDIQLSGHVHHNRASNRTLVLMSVACFAGSVALAGCNTTKGLGEDLEDAGEAISDKAEEVKE